jgi:hypothetical protein
VVLNRVRHPAFPKSVCGVVFQGAERPTGCQFTFTCDGSLGRKPSAEGWRAARKIAEAALAGAVYAKAGQATHYHTRWVVPYWASELAKIGDVGAHIFYRWQGPWGQPAAFKAAYTPPEADVFSLYGVGAAPFEEPKAELAPAAELAAVDAAAPDAVRAPAVNAQASALASLQAEEEAPPPAAAPVAVAATTPAVVNPVAAPARRPRLAVPTGW